MLAIGFYCDEDGCVMHPNLATHYAVLYEDPCASLDSARNVSRAWFFIALEAA